jgi:hypothetical protein
MGSRSIRQAAPSLDGGLRLLLGITELWCLHDPITLPLLRLKPEATEDAQSILQGSNS